MLLNDSYEDMSPEEADLILDIYNVIDYFVYHSYPVTLVGISRYVGVEPKELADYLPIIMTILNKVEEEYAQIQQRPN